MLRSFNNLHSGLCGICPSGIVHRQILPSAPVSLPLGCSGLFLPVWFFVHLLVSLFIKPWKEEDLNWLFLSIDIIISGVGATTVL